MRKYAFKVDKYEKCKNNTIRQNPIMIGLSDRISAMQYFEYVHLFQIGGSHATLHALFGTLALCQEPDLFIPTGEKG